MTDAVEDVATFGDAAAGSAARWINELDLSDRFQKDYQDKRCKVITDRYRDKRDNASAPIKRKYAVFWSVIETMKPACLSHVPNAVVLRRYKDHDPIGRVASEVLERAINCTFDAYDYDQVLKSCRDDFLLYARGTAWLRYVPTFGPAPAPENEADTDVADEGLAGTPPSTETLDGDDAAGPDGEVAPDQVVTYEEVICDHVAREDFGTNAARTWAEVRFVWRRAYMTREQLKKRFPTKLPDDPSRTVGDVVPLDWKPSEANNDQQKAQQFAKAMVFEIWDKDSKKVFWISKSYPARPLDERADPLGLRDFFPCPKPAYGTLAPDSIIPIPDYIYYQDQAEEVDDLTMRIGMLTPALRMVGVYAGAQNMTLQNVFKPSTENSMINIDDWATFTSKGGVTGMMDWVPVDMVGKVLTGLFETRQRLMDDIDRVTGISDIMRGDTDANETAAAQKLKSTWGSSRIREKQKELARFSRDAMRIAGEVIAEKFSIETLKQMTNVKLLTRAEKEQIGQQQAAWQAASQQQQAMAQPQPAMPGAPQAPPAPQRPPPPNPTPPEMLKLMGEPTWEDVKERLESDALREFTIDIEADSTIEADQAHDQMQATEFVTAMGSLLAQALPAVQAAPALGEFLGEIIKFTARRFQVGREFEEVLDRTMENIAKQPPTPPEGTEKAGKSPEELMVEQDKNAVAREKNQISLKKIQSDDANSQRDYDQGVRQDETERARTQADIVIAQEGTESERIKAAAAALKPKPSNGAGASA